MSELAEKLERRRHERLPAVVDLELTSRGRQFGARLADISESGLRCHLDDATQPPGEGEVLELRISLGRGEPVRILAQVMRSVPGDLGHQLGLQFQAVDESLRQQLLGHLSALRPALARA